jgi:HEAT repeat protein
LLVALHDEKDIVRAAALFVLGLQYEQFTEESVLLTIGDENEFIRCIAIAVLNKRKPDDLLKVVPEAIAVLQGKEPGQILGSITQGFLAEMIGDMKNVPSALLNKLTQLLDWPHWQVRLKAIKALGKIRSNIPDATLRRLYVLRRDSDPTMQVIREAADDVLADILSLETGLEDEESV